MLTTTSGHFQKWSNTFQYVKERSKTIVWETRKVSCETQFANSNSGGRLILKGPAIIFSGQKNPFIIFRSKERYKWNKSNNKNSVKLMKLWMKMFLFLFLFVSLFVCCLFLFLFLFLFFVFCFLGFFVLFCFCKFHSWRCCKQCS